jgi:hypothetical protein
MRRVYLILSESDRERLGAPEKLLVKLEDITAREQGTLQHAFRYDDMVAISDALSGLFEKNDKDEITRIRRNADLFLALTWLGLRNAGVFTAIGRTEMTAELDGLDIQINKVSLEPDDDETLAAKEAAEAAEGKDSSSTPTRTSTD